MNSLYVANATHWRSSGAGVILHINLKYKRKFEQFLNEVF